MIWLYNYLFSTYPRHRKKKVWLKVKIRHETDKAILVLYEGVKTWIPKSRIRGIKIKRREFWIKLTRISN